METVIYAFNRESIRIGAFTVGPLSNETIMIFNNNTLTHSLTYSVKEM